MAKSQLNHITDQTVSLLEGWFAKLPSMSSRARGIIVKIVPWYAIIFGILGVISSVAVLGALSFFQSAVPADANINTAGLGMVLGILGLASSGLLVIAFSGLRAKKVKGWKFLFWGELLSVLGSLVAFSVTGVIFGVVGLYLIFQIKSYYK